MADNRKRNFAGKGSREHARVLRQIMARCGARDDCRLWINNTGVGKSLSHDGLIRFGLRGSTDILGIYRGGYFIALEVKTGRAKLTKSQIAFETMIVGFGGFHGVVSSANEAEMFLDSLYAFAI